MLQTSKKIGIRKPQNKSEQIVHHAKRGNILLCPCLDMKSS